MAPHTPQESPKVKTKCVRIGSCRLYAPMVPLAPHPCVRWWNTEEMPLKLTRLCLHSLRGGSSHQKPSYPVGQMSSPARLSPENHPPRRRGYQRTRSGIPPTQRQWRKRDHGSLKRKSPETKGIPQGPSPEGYHSSTNPTPGCTAPSQDFHWSTFSFSESRTTFSFASKRKSGFGPCRAGKNQRKVKTSRFPTKEKADSPGKGYAPSGFPPTKTPRPVGTLLTGTCQDREPPTFNLHFVHCFDRQAVVK